MPAYPGSFTEKNTAVEPRTRLPLQYGALKMNHKNCVQKVIVKYSLFLTFIIKKLQKKSQLSIHSQPFFSLLDYIIRQVFTHVLTISLALLPICLRDGRSIAKTDFFLNNSILYNVYMLVRQKVKCPICLYRLTYCSSNKTYM